MSATATDLNHKTQEAKQQLDAHVREIVEWHFNPATGCPFWLDFAAKLDWDPRREINSFEDLRKFPAFPRRMVAWRAGAALAAEGTRRQAALYF
jgi:hypothetical protein